MKKIFSCRVLALALAMMLCFSLTVPAFAVDTNAYTAVAGTTTTFDKVLIMPVNAEVPNRTFTYTIAAGSAVAATPGSTVAVLAGNDSAVTGSPTVSNAVFAPGNATITENHAWATIASGKKAATQQVTVDFSGVTFSEPGIYRYVITENSTAQQAITFDTQKGASATAYVRYLDVYVTASGSTLSVSGYVLHEGTAAPAASATYGTNAVTLGDKSHGYVNEYTSYDLTLSNEVYGNQASQDKYFKFDIVIENAGNGTAFTVDWSGAVDAQNAVKSPSTNDSYTETVIRTANQKDDNNTIAGNQWVTDASGNLTTTVYLKHDQEIVIQGLPAGTTYTITETPEDYKSSYSHNGGDSTDGTVVTQSTGINEDQSAHYRNTRNGAVPTGVYMNSMAGGIVAALGFLGFAAVVMAMRKKRATNA